MSRRCPTGKIRYRNENRAQRALGSAWRAFRPARKLECRAYQCDRCGGWHLTSMPEPPGTVTT